MRDQRYGDNRDLVKWGVLLELPFNRELNGLSIH
jgi:hypothetical protein